MTGGKEVRASQNHPVKLPDQVSATIAEYSRKIEGFWGVSIVFWVISLPNERGKGDGSDRFQMEGNGDRSQPKSTSEAGSENPIEEQGRERKMVFGTNFEVFSFFFKYWLLLIP